MGETTMWLLPTGVSLVVCGLIVLLGRRSNAQFATGSAILFALAFAVPIIFDSVQISVQPAFWQSGYATVFPFLSMIYVIAHTSIWRSFAKPGWAAFLSMLPIAWFFASAGFWEVIV